MEFKIRLNMLGRYLAINRAGTKVIGVFKVKERK